MARYTQDEVIDPNQDYTGLVRQNILDGLSGGDNSAPTAGRTTFLPGDTFPGDTPTYPPKVAHGDPNGGNTSGYPGNPGNIVNPPSSFPAPAPSPGTQPPPSAAPAPPPPTAQPAPVPPPTSTLNTETPGYTAQPSSGGTGPSVGSTLPPDIAKILDQLAQGFASFRAPQVTYTPQTTPAYDDAVRSAIMSALQEGQRPVDASDPIVAPMLAAMQGQGQRAKDYNSQQLAERLSSQNLLHSGAYDVGQAGYNQAIDEAQSGQTAQLMTQVLTDRRNRLMQALQLGANYLNADQARQLQAELSNVNSALGGFQAKSGVGLGLLSSLLNNQQFYDSLGLQAGVDQAALNAGAVPQLPQGLTF